jgi:quercetin dioxygenase-like cupin family protein
MFGSRSDDGYREMLEGVKVKALTCGEKTLTAEFLLSKGSAIPEHSHPNEQAGYLVKGRLRLYVESKSKEMNPGDSWCVPSNVRHKVDVLEDSVAVEVFSPRREDYVKYLNRADLED